MTATSQIGDLVVTLAFGFLAWLMHKLGWPVVPLILGLVLGHRAENTLWISSRIYGWSMFARPVVIVLIILAIAAIVFALTKMRAGVDLDAEDEPVNMPIARVAFSLFAFGLAAAAVIISLEWPAPARLFPMAIGSVTASVAFIQLIFDVVKLVRYREDHRESKTEVTEESRVTNRRTVEIFGWLVGLFAAIWAVGFTVIVGPFLLLYLKITARETWKSALIAAGVSAAIYWGFFHMFLKVATPAGQFIRL